jgi:hypothetical protein
MYYLIHNRLKSEVLGIVDEREVLDPDQVGNMIDLSVYHPPGKYHIEDAMRDRLRHVIECNIESYHTNWSWEEITEAEYGTYRVLHGFKVFKRYG